MIFPQITLCKDNKVLHNEFVVERCEFDRIDCRDKFDLVSVYDDFGRKRECLRFNGGKLGLVIRPRDLKKYKVLF